MGIAGMEAADMESLGLATTLTHRLKGMLCSDSWDGELLLAPCHDVHTVGMRYAIDVAFLGEDGLVMKAVRDVGPGRRIRCRGACAVLERQADDARSWYTEGQRVAMCGK